MGSHHVLSNGRVGQVGCRRAAVGLAAGVLLQALSAAPPLSAQRQGVVVPRDTANVDGFFRYPLGVVYMRPGADASGFWGEVFVSLGDVDGDGILDFAASNLTHDAATFGHMFRASESTIAKVAGVSGRQGRPIWIARDPADSKTFGYSLARVGDLDGDGADDLVVAGDRVLTKLSGRTGEVIARVEMPLYPIPFTRLRLAGPGDLDGDGVPDYLVATPSIYEPGTTSTTYGRVYAHSGKDDHVIWVAEGEERWSKLGFSLEPADDINGDGVREIAAAASTSTHPERAPGGFVYIIDGATGVFLRRLEDDVPFSRFGKSMALAADIDGDGVRELAIGAPAYPARGLANVGRVTVHNLKTGEIVWSRTGTGSYDWRVSNWTGSISNAKPFGWVVANVGDIDLDGFDDVAVSDFIASLNSMSYGSVFLLSGRSGEDLAVYTQDAFPRSYATAGFGSAMLPLGDITGDGRPEFIATDLYRVERGVAALGGWRALEYATGGPAFLRGDGDNDGNVDMADVAAVVELLLGLRKTECPALVDVNLDGHYSLSDPVYMLVYFFEQGPAIPPPFPYCARYFWVEIPWGNPGYEPIVPRRYCRQTNCP